MKPDSVTAFALNQLASLDGLTGPVMFGCYGLYRGDGFFGILQEGRLHYKTARATGSLYQARGMKPFPTKAQTPTSFFEGRVDLIEDPDQLVTWAQPTVPSRAERTARARQRTRPRP